MPTVRLYGPRQVFTEPLPGVRKTAALTEEAAGVGLARARFGTAQTLAQVGGHLAQVGFGEYGQMVREERDRADEIAVREAETTLGQWENQRLYADNGALAQKGKNALGLPDQVGQDYQKLVGELEQGLTTPRQKWAFRRVAMQRGVNLDTTIQRHVFNETQTYERNTLEASVANSVNLAVANALDPRRVSQELDRAVTAIQASAPRLGFSPEQVQQQVGNARSATHEGVINRLLVNGQDQAAQAYFDAAKEQINGDRLATVEHALESGTSAATGLRTATALWGEHGPKTDDDPIELDKMESSARSQLGSNPKALDSAIAHLRQMKTAADASRADRKEAIAGNLWQAVNTPGMTLQHLQAMPAYTHAPGALQLQVTEHLINRQEAAAQRGTAQQTRHERELETKGWAKFWELSDPQTLATMTDNQILTMTPELGQDHVNRLMTAKRSLGHSADRILAATIDDNAFKTIAQGAGLDPYAKRQTPEAQARLGQLRNSVEQEIDREQGARKRPLTRDEKDAVMKRVVDTRVMLDVWGTDTSLPAASVLNPKDAKAAYVPLEQIPAQSVGEWVNVIRAQIPAAQRMNRDEILARWRDRIQRAHAAHVLGLGADEELKRLQGR